MEERIPELVEELQDFCGKIIPMNVLEGRGYAHALGPNDVATKFPALQNYSYSEEALNDVPSDDEDDYEDDYDDEIVINETSVYNYIAENVLDQKGNYWFKAIAANPEDIGNQEAYMVIVLEGEDVESSFKINCVSVFARMVEQLCGGMFSIPGYQTLDSHFFEMSMVPPEVRQGLDKLVSGRYLPDGFNIIGKPMPSDTYNFHPNPPYSAAANSGIRNVYWHNSITVDDSNDIEDIDISTYEREVSMFQRPHSMDSCYYDYLEALLYIVDQYNDDEWKLIQSK